MSAMASQITGASIVCLTVCSGADQRKHQSSASLAFVSGIHRWLVDSPHKGPVTRKMFSFDDVIMKESWVVEPGVVFFWWQGMTCFMTHTTTQLPRVPWALWHNNIPGDGNINSDNSPRPDLPTPTPTPPLTNLNNIVYKRVLQLTKLFDLCNLIYMCFLNIYIYISFCKWKISVCFYLKYTT